MTVKEALEFAAAYLAGRGLRFPQQDAELLVISILRRDRAFLHAHPEFELPLPDESIFHQWLNKRGEHYPLQYLRGKQEFYGREFLVHPGVFIPRPETELLIEVGMGLLGQSPEGRVFAADVGTGSGCIAVTLACQRSDLMVTAIDVSAVALQAARHNADVHNCLDRIEFRQGSMLSVVKERRAHYHLIVSNPPYVGLQERSRVDMSVKKYEPREAVFSGESGLAAYPQLFEQSKELLRPGGGLVLELAAGGLQPVVLLGQKEGWVLNQVGCDLAGIERCAVFQICSSDKIF